MKVVESEKLKENIKDTRLGAASSQVELFKDACTIIEQAQTVAYRAINETLIKRNWLLGLRIQHEILKGKRAEYGEKVIKMLAKDLVKRFGNGFSKANLYHFTAFYNCFPDIFYAVSRKSETIPATTELTYTADLYEQIQIKIYDELVRPEGHNPTIGLLLCADTDEDVAHYSVLSSNDQLFVAKYLTYMPTKEDLRREIEQQKEFFRLQCKENKDKQ